MGLTRKKGNPQLTADGKEIVLGQKYRDNLHHQEGTAVARYEYLNGCDRICLEFMHGGEIKSVTFDVVQLEEIPEPPKVKEQRRTGGPERQMPSSLNPA